VSSLSAGRFEGFLRPEAGRDAAPAGRVLPRFLRRPLRFLVALTRGHVHIPQHSGSLAAAAFLAATGVYGVQLGGHSEDFWQMMTSGAGFALEDVHISGNVATSDIDVLQQLGLNGATSVISIDAEAARQALIDLPWVVDAQVTKVYPKSLAVKLVEREPVAIWQHGSELSYIDARGDIIAPMNGSRYAHLPLYVGLGADKHADELEARLIFHPEIRSRVKAAIRIADRRWDLRLDNGVTIALPETGIDAAFERFARFDGGRGVLDRDIALVDLRLADRVTLRLTDAAFERRQAAVEARAKALKAARKRS
jgi:Cell division septal protein